MFCFVFPDLMRLCDKFFLEVNAFSEAVWIDDWKRDWN